MTCNAPCTIHAAFGGAPHQSSPGSEEPRLDSFSPRGEAFVPYPTFLVLSYQAHFTTKGFSLEGEAGKNRFPKNRFLTDVGVLPPLAAGRRPMVALETTF